MDDIPCAKQLRAVDHISIWDRCGKPATLFYCKTGIKRAHYRARCNEHPIIYKAEMSGEIQEISRDEFVVGKIMES